VLFTHVVETIARNRILALGLLPPFTSSLLGTILLARDAEADANRACATISNASRRLAVM